MNHPFLSNVYGGTRPTINEAVGTHVGPPKPTKVSHNIICLPVSSGRGMLTCRFIPVCLESGLATLIKKGQFV